MPGPQRLDRVRVGLSLGVYTAIAEWHFGKTVGKHLLGLRVVRESGARISFGQAVVRQLPQWLQVFWIDALFAFFTEKHQRAFNSMAFHVVHGEGRTSLTSNGIDDVVQPGRRFRDGRLTRS